MRFVNDGCVILVAVALATAANGQADRTSLKSATVDDLKQAYLMCDAQAASGRLPASAIMWCSVIYEELKDKAFGGEFEKLLAWSRTRAMERPLATHPNN